MPDGYVFGHIRRAKHLTISCVGWVPAIADEECGRPLGGVSVIVSQNIRIGLHEESNIGVAARQRASRHRHDFVGTVTAGRANRDARYDLQSYREIGSLRITAQLVAATNEDDERAPGAPIERNGRRAGERNLDDVSRCDPRTTYDPKPCSMQSDRASS